MVYDIICVKKILIDPVVTNLRWHKVREKDVVGIVTFELIGYFLPITLLLQWHVRVYKETFSVNIKIAQTMQNIWNSACEQRAWLFEILLSKVYWRNGKHWGLSGRFLETRRYGPNLESSRIIQESWQHW